MKFSLETLQKLSVIGKNKEHERVAKAVSTGMKKIRYYCEGAASEGNKSSGGVRVFAHQRETEALPVFEKALTQALMTSIPSSHFKIEEDHAQYGFIVTVVW